MEELDEEAAEEFPPKNEAHIVDLPVVGDRPKERRLGHDVLAAEGYQQELSDALGLVEKPFEKMDKR